MKYKRSYLNMKLDEIDVMILSQLQKDSRLSIRELSKRINLSPPSVTERVRKLEDSGVIEKYTIKINKKKLGLFIDCIVKVTMKNGEYERFKIFVNDYPKSEWCYRIAGDGCFLVKLSISDLNEVEEFINLISSYALTSTIVAFSSVEIDDDIKKFLL
jgi:Lrp/AsnC family leucine-responsive transcriptional regulator